MPIGFGIFDHIETHGGRSAEEIYEQRIALLKRAEEGGFYGFHLAEHHGHSLSASPTAAVFLAALARETTTLKLIPTVVCLPLHHPVRVLEDLAMLDVLSHGRLELGVGKGITPFEPVQRPYPPLWSAGNPAKAGAGGHNFIFPLPMPVEMRAHYDELRAASRQEPGHQNPHVEDPWIAQCQGLVIADTDEEAEAIARRAWGVYTDVLQIMHGTVPPHLQTEVPDWDNPLAKDMMSRDPMEAELVVAGSVDRVREYYVEQARRGVTNYFILMLPFGDMTHEEESRTLEAFITDVIPAVREVETAAAHT